MCRKWQLLGWRSSAAFFECSSWKMCRARESLWALCVRHEILMRQSSSRSLACRQTTATAIFAHLNPFKIDVSIKSWFTAGNSSDNGEINKNAKQRARGVFYCFYLHAANTRLYWRVCVCGARCECFLFLHPHAENDKGHTRGRRKEKTRQLAASRKRTTRKLPCLFCLSIGGIVFWEKNIYSASFSFLWHASGWEEYIQTFHLLLQKKMSTKSTLPLVTYFSLLFPKINCSSICTVNNIAGLFLNCSDKELLWIFVFNLFYCYLGLL